MEQITRLCQGEVESYAIVYGGRQTGKTSLLYRLHDRLAQKFHICHVDFQFVPQIATPEAYAYLAQRVAESTPQLTYKPEIASSTDLIQFLLQVVSQPRFTRLVMLIEELGALHREARQDLANVLRAIFTNRVNPAYGALGRVMIVIAGSIELYELAVVDVSPLNNICEPVYLPDLSEIDAVELIADGFADLGLLRNQAEELGAAIYSHVQGHPSLTQHIGSLLEQELVQGTMLTPDHVDKAIAHLMQYGSPLIDHLQRALIEQDLLNAAHNLLHHTRRFSRMDAQMVRLELLGLACERNSLWQVRNPFLSQLLQDWIAS
jgi:hypothetical protein